MEHPGRVVNFVAAALALSAMLGLAGLILDRAGYDLDFFAYNLFSTADDHAASIFGADDRRELTSAEDRAHAGVGVFAYQPEKNGDSYTLGTGFLMLRDDVVLTSAHLFFGPDGQPTVPQEQIIFYPSGQTMLNVRVKSAWFGTTAPTRLNPEDDWAVMQLDQRIAGAQSYLYRDFAAPEESRGELVHVAFHSDLAYYSRYSERISAYDGRALLDRHLLLHRCDTSNAAEGAPLLVAKPVGGFAVAGIHSRGAVGTHPENGEPNVAVLADRRLAERISAIIDGIPKR